VVTELSGVDRRGPYTALEYPPDAGAEEFKRLAARGERSRLDMLNVADGDLAMADSGGGLAIAAPNR
jgi:hypothetical protein